MKLDRLKILKSIVPVSEELIKKSIEMVDEQNKKSEREKK